VAGGGRQAAGVSKVAGAVGKVAGVCRMGVANGEGKEVAAGVARAASRTAAVW